MTNTLMNKEGKIWGFTSKIFEHNNVSVHRLFIKNNSGSSKHFHKIKYNFFYVESGEIEISIWQNDYNLVDKTILKSGESITIKPGLYHSFHGLLDSIVYEIYYSKIDDNDIFRENCGYINN